MVGKLWGWTLFRLVYVVSTNEELKIFYRHLVTMLATNNMSVTKYELSRHCEARPTFHLEM